MGLESFHLLAVSQQVSGPDIVLPHSVEDLKKMTCVAMPGMKISIKAISPTLVGLKLCRGFMCTTTLYFDVYCHITANHECDRSCLYLE